MYKNFFGLRENPFNVNPDPRFLYLTLQTQKALDELTYGIQTRKGLILLTGEVGTGKTTLINCLLDWLRQQKTPTAFVFNSRLSTDQFFEFMLTDFGIPVDVESKSNMLMRLNAWLIECFRSGKSPVLIVDEGQGLSSKLLDEIRLLLNLETPSGKLLQIVLAGQPELDDKLRRPELRQLRQRITLRCSTGPLALEESRGYITERLRISGATGDPIFASDAMDAAHFYSQGIPRVMNLLCEHALMNAYAEQLRPVPARIVEQAARTFFLDQRRRFAKEEDANLQARSHATSLPELAAYDAFEKPAATTRNRTVTTARQPAGLSASMAKSKAAAFLEGSLLASAGPELKSKESARCLDAIPRGSGFAIPLDTHENQNQVTNLSCAPLHSIHSRTEDESSSAVGRSPISEAQYRTPRSSRGSAMHALLLSWKAWSPRRVPRLLPSVSLAKWSRVSRVALRRIRQSVFLGQALLRRWRGEVKGDWMAMFDSLRCSRGKKSFLR